jgi:hypothetical protein
MATSDPAEHLRQLGVFGFKIVVAIKQFHFDNTTSLGEFTNR